MDCNGSALRDFDEVQIGYDKDAINSRGLASKTEMISEVKDKKGGNWLEKLDVNIVRDVCVRY